jgi:hypothetical protein
VMMIIIIITNGVMWLLWRIWLFWCDDG